MGLIKGVVVLLTAMAVARIVRGRPATHSTDRLARLVNLPRLRGESLAAWDARVEAAFMDLKATVASIREAMYQGRGQIIAVMTTPMRHMPTFSKRPAGKAYGPN